MGHDVHIFTHIIMTVQVILFTPLKKPQWVEISIKEDLMIQQYKEGTSQKRD